MLDKAYSYSCLEGFEGIQETIACPKKGSLSGWTISKIEYLDLYSNQDMDGFFGIVLSRVLAIALPILSLLDVLASPCKALYFAATREPKKSMEELKNTVIYLALALFSTFSIPVALYKPTLIYLSDSTWIQIKQKHVKENLQREFQKCCKTSSSNAETFSEALEQTLPKIFKSKNFENSIQKVLEAITQQLEHTPDESTILLDHFHHWTSVFLVACQKETLPIDKVDQSFHDLIVETIRMKNPTLREEMTNRIVKDYAKGAPVVNQFKTQLETFEQERQINIETYKEEQKAVKLKEKERIEQRIKGTRATLAGKTNQKAIDGISGRIKDLEAQLEGAGVINDLFLEGVEKRAHEVFPEFSTRNYAYLSLYFILSNTNYTDKLLEVVRSSIFKDCHQRHFLLNFLLLLNKNNKNLDVDSLLKGFIKACQIDKGNADRRYPAMIRYLKNCTILIQLKEWTLLRSSEPPLYSNEIIPELFKSRFQLKKYSKEESSDLFLNDYETSFAKFRDPTTIMILYSTLSQLSKNERESAITGLTQYVAHTLSSAEDLHKFRHDTEGSTHLNRCYQIQNTLKDLWETCNFSPLADDDPRYANYTIGEAHSPCDLLMSSQEVLKSCLHPAGRPHKVKGFLAILLDGKIHPVVIKAPSGKIVARMLLKLLINETDESLALMIDTVYTNSHHQEEVYFFEKKIKEYSKQKALKLDIPLISSEKSDSECGTSIGPLISLKGPSPFEHVNAFEGPHLAKQVVFENGEYSIPKAYVVS